MHVPWKIIGLAGVAGVAASGAVVVRRRRGQQDYDPDGLREKLHERLAETRGAEPASPGVASEEAQGGATDSHTPAA